MSLHRRSTLAYMYFLIYLSHLTAAQNVATLTGHPTQFMTTSPSGANLGSLFAASSVMPSATDSAPGGSNNGGTSNGSSSNGLVNYYFVFIALIISAAGISIFLLLRRRKRKMARYRAAPAPRSSTIQPFGVDASELQHNRSGWDNWSPERRRYWPRFSREAETGREEGLDEHGLAPPPYRPKTANREDADAVTVPPPVATRDDTGFKPPDYSETQTDDVNGRSPTRDGNSQQ